MELCDEEQKIRERQRFEDLYWHVHGELRRIAIPHDDVQRERQREYKRRQRQSRREGRNPQSETADTDRAKDIQGDARERSAKRRRIASEEKSETEDRTERARSI